MSCMVKDVFGGRLTLVEGPGLVVARVESADGVVVVELTFEASAVRWFAGYAAEVAQSALEAGPDRRGGRR